MILFTDQLQRANSDDPIVDSSDVKGGLVTVETESKLDKIQISKLKDGMLAYVKNEDQFYQYHENEGWQRASFNSSGIPVHTTATYESQTSKPEEYLWIRDPSLQGSAEDNQQINIKKGGDYVDILFSALRSLQHEVAKLKNTFASGIVSYVGENTAGSTVINKSEEESEPLWAIDPEDLAELEDVSIPIDSDAILIPATGYTIGENVINCQDCVYNSNTEDIEESQLCLYSKIDPKADDWEFNIVLPEDESINFKNIIPKQKCNILTIISRQSQLEDNSFVGNNYIWISVTKNNKDLVMSGYYNPETKKLQKNQYSLNSYNYIKQLYFKNVDLYKCSFYVREQSFTNVDVIPNQITTDDFAFKAAHITIRAVADKVTLTRVSTRILNNELIYVEDEGVLYIKSNNVVRPISGGSSEDIGGGNTNNGMTQEELKQWLLDNNYITSDNEFNPISDITFVHEGSGKKFKMGVDSEGIFSGKEIINIQEDTGNDATQFVSRGAVAYYNIGKSNYEKTGNSIVSNIVDGEIQVKGDRVRISKWYIPNKNQNKFNCSHGFIEITNCSTFDYPLNNAVLHIIKTDPQDATNRVSYSFELDGIVKGGSSYIIRASQYIDLNSPLAYVKVSEYDYELWKDNQLFDLTGTEAILLAHENLNLSVNKSNKTKLKSNSTTGDDYFMYQVQPGLIDVITLNKNILDYFSDNNAKTWTDAAYKTINNSIVKDQYFLDPAKQAFRSLTSKSETSNCRLNKVATEIIPLDDNKVSFYHTDNTQDVSLYGPIRNSNVCSDKSKLDENKPNMVVCSFGIDGYKTRCFNWVSIGYFDEYLWLRKKGESEWNKGFESYKIGNHTLTQDVQFPRKKIYTDEVIINSIYNRIDGVFPANNQPYRIHKLIIDVNETPESNQEYEYIVGRALKNGNPNLEHCSDIQTFTMHDSSWTPKIFLTSDQQGFTWMEYQVWAAAAKEIEQQIPKLCGEKEFPVLINTGDATQNGTRVNEWYDYFDAAKCLTSKYEHSAVIGNNDLANSYSENFLGTGDDSGKSSPYYYNLFNCYEVPTNFDFEFTEKDDWNHPLIYKNKYIPSIYYFTFDNKGFLMVNSELTTTTCDIYYNAKINNNIINLYTGFCLSDNSYETRYCLKDTISKMLNKMSGKHIIAACHEMPFTVIGQDYLLNSADKQPYLALDRCLQFKNKKNLVRTQTSLIGSHLNRISADMAWDNDNNYWFSKLLESENIKLCIGGHKHTYCCTYPIREYRDGDTFESGVSLSKQATIKRSDLPEGITQVSAGDNYFKWNVDKNLSDGVVYFMVQATGFKLASNKELPSAEQIFSKIVPKTSNGKADVSQSYPMYAVIGYETNNYYLDLYRISGIKKESFAKEGDTKVTITEFSQTNYSTEKLFSEKLLLFKNSTKKTENGVTEYIENNYYDNYWLVDNSVKNYNQDQQRCFIDNNNFYSMDVPILEQIEDGGEIKTIGKWNNKDHTEIIAYGTT